MSTAVERTTADYQDLSFEQLRLVSDYVMRNSVPVNLTTTEIQMVISALMDLINISVNNLNILRELEGKPDFYPEVAGKEDPDDYRFDVEPIDWAELEGDK